MKFKLLTINNITLKNICVLNEIISRDEVVIIPKTYTYQNLRDIVTINVTHIGYKIRRDDRTERERLEDDYRFYCPETNSLDGVEVPVSKNVKKIVISSSIKQISKDAFKNLTGVTFEVDEDNANFKVADGKLINKETGEILYKG